MQNMYRVAPIHVPFPPEVDTPYADKVFAQRFKTKMCAKFLENDGWCPYECRCTFAHGEHELRTTELNLQEGLTSEAAIKAFKLAQSPVKKLTLKKKRANERRALAKALAASQETPSYQSTYRHDPYGFVAINPHFQLRFTEYFDESNEDCSSEFSCPADDPSPMRPPPATTSSEDGMSSAASTHSPRIVASSEDQWPALEEL